MNPFVWAGRPAKVAKRVLYLLLGVWRFQISNLITGRLSFPCVPTYTSLEQPNAAPLILSPTLRSGPRGGSPLWNMWWWLVNSCPFRNWGAYIRCLDPLNLDIGNYCMPSGLFPQPVVLESDSIERLLTSSMMEKPLSSLYLYLTVDCNHDTKPTCSFDKWRADIPALKEDFISSFVPSTIVAKDRFIRLKFLHRAYYTPPSWIQGALDVILR